MRLEVSNDIFLQHYFTRETEISSLSLVSMSKLLVSFRQFEKSLRVNASDLCCYEALGNMLGNGIYGFSDPGKYIWKGGCSVGARNWFYGKSLTNFS